MIYAAETTHSNRERKLVRPLVMRGQPRPLLVVAQGAFFRRALRQFDAAAVNLV
jgi:hypothetical protein